MLSRALEKTLRRTLALANARQHEHATLEHLLMSLTEDQDSVAVLKACAVDLDRLRTGLFDYLDHELSGLVVEGSVDAKPTASFQRVIQRAAIHVESSGRNEVTGANVLVALFSERESQAVLYLQEQKMSRLDAVNYIAHGIAKSGRGASFHAFGTGRPIDGTSTSDDGSEPTGSAGISQGVPMPWSEDLISRLADEVGRRMRAGVDPMADKTQQRAETCQKLRVFLCHASEDKNQTRDLYQKLMPYVEPWLDEENLLYGQNWDAEIRLAVQKCDIVLVLLSKNSTNKEGYVQREIRFALDIADEKRDDRIFIIPLLLEDCVVPERLKKYHYGRLEDDRGFRYLLRSLSKCAEDMDRSMELPPK